MKLRGGSIYKDFTRFQSHGCSQQDVSIEESLIRTKKVPSDMVWKIHNEILCLGYKKSQGDHALVCKHIQEGKRIILLVYDDIIVTRDYLSKR